MNLRLKWQRQEEDKGDDLDNDNDNNHIHNFLTRIRVFLKKYKEMIRRRIGMEPKEAREAREAREAGRFSYTYQIQLTV